MGRKAVFWTAGPGSTPGRCRKRDMKISPYDRIQALRHSSQYRTDYYTYLKEKADEKKKDDYRPDFIIGSPRFERKTLSKAALKLCKKYNLIYPLNPEENEKKEWEKTWVELFAHKPISLLAPASEWESLTGYCSKAVIENEEKVIKEIPAFDTITHINGKLVLMIDLSYPGDYIRDEFEKYLNEWLEKRWHEEKGVERKGSKPTQVRKKGRKIDKWAVYKIKTKNPQKSYGRIAKELFPPEVEGGKIMPQYISENEIKQIQRAYKEAYEIIKIIEKPSK